jgi:hypothetical protein
MHPCELHQNTQVDFGIHRTFVRAPEARAGGPVLGLDLRLEERQFGASAYKDALRVLKQWAQLAYSMASCPRTSY